jgi:hypothetical protein
MAAIPNRTASDPSGLDGKVIGGPNATDHQSIMVDLRNASGEIIGALADDFAADG